MRGVQFRVSADHLSRSVGFGLMGLLIVVSGCGKSGPPMAPVSGKVTLNGEPLPTGSVMFIPTTGPYATADIQEDGSYQLQTFKKGDGAVIGRHRVLVNAVHFPNPELPEAVPLVPDKYTNEQTSGIEVEVKDQPNTIDLVLEGSVQGRVRKPR